MLYQLLSQHLPEFPGLGSFKVYPLQVFVSVWNFRAWIQVLSLLPSSQPLALNFCLSLSCASNIQPISITTGMFLTNSHDQLLTGVIITLFSFCPNKKEVLGITRRPPK